MVQENLVNENKEYIVIIRKATLDDFKGFREVHYQSWLATYINEDLGITKEDIDKRFEDKFSDGRFEKYQKIIEDPNGRVLVAIHKNQVVGFVDFHKDPTHNTLRGLYVHPNFIGKKVGIKLWQAGQDFLDSNLPTELEVASYNQRAINFYEKLGFKMTDKPSSSPPVMPVSGVTLPVEVMELKPANI